MKAKRSRSRLTLPGLSFLMLALTCPATAGAEYETSTVNCQTYFVGRAEGAEVWLLPMKGTELGLFLQVVNLGERPFDVVPGRIRGKAISQQAGKKISTRLKTYGPREYEYMHSPSAHAFTPIATGWESRSTSRPASSPSSVPLSLVYLERSLASLGVRPSDSRASAASSRSVPRAPTQSGVGGYGISPDTTQLLWPSTVPVGGSISGSVYLKYRPAESYHVVIPIAGELFEFDFTLP